MTLIQKRVERLLTAATSADSRNISTKSLATVLEGSDEQPEAEKKSTKNVGGKKKG